MGALAVVHSIAKGRNAHGEGDVAVRGAGTGLGALADIFLQQIEVELLQLLLALLVHLAHAGPLAEELQLHLCVGALPLCQDLAQAPLHLFQAFPIVGTDFVEHGGALGDGVHRGAALDEANVVGGLGSGLLRGLDRVQLGDEPRQDLDGVAVSKAAKAVPALRRGLDLVTGGADRLVARK